MKKLLIIAILLCSLSSIANKIYPSKGGDGGFFAKNFAASPGDTIVLRSSDNNRSYFALDYLVGTAQNPIVIINEGGQVVLTSGMDLKNMHHVHITGTGNAGTYYGFKVIGNTTGVAFGISKRSEDVELDHVESYNCMYGVWAKQDPSCVDSLNYPNWIMDSIKVHDCKFKKTGQDVMYMGNTVSINGITLDCGSGNVTKYPIRLANVDVYNIIIDSAARTGIQLGECMSGKVHDCNIANMGYEYVQDQGTGISIGGQSYNIRVYNDTVSKTFLYGIMNFGKGKNYIYNNVVDSSGIIYIDPALDMDSLVRKLDTAIAITYNTTGWNTGNKHMRYSGRYLFNVFSQPCNISMAPSYDLLMYPTLDSSTVVIRNNKLGQSVVVDGNWNVINGNANKINIFDYNRNPIGYDNYICNNTLMDSVTPAATAGVPTGFHYYSGCGKTPVIIFRGRLNYKPRQ